VPAVSFLRSGQKSLAIRNLLIGSFLIFLSVAMMGMAFSLGADGLLINIKNLLMRMGCLVESQNEEEESCEIIEIVNYHGENGESDEEAEKKMQMADGGYKFSDSSEC